MEFGSKNKINTAFSASSLTDIIFLLLIFFMLTSNFITPSGIAVTLPQGRSAKVIIQKTNVSISSDLEYYIDDKEIVKEELWQKLQDIRVESEEQVILLNIDKRVPHEHFVYAGDIANALGFKVSIATQPITHVE